MFSLQLSITNFINVNQNSILVSQQNITLRYGPLQTQIQIQNGSGGKKIIFQMNHNQIQQLFSSYACGLFIKNQQGKYFAILSLQNLQINSPIQNFIINFQNQQKNVIYQAKITIQLNQYNPRLPKNINSKVLNNNYAKFINQASQKRYDNPTINSFLYGNNKNLKNRNYQNPNNVLKNMIPPRVPINANNFNKSNNINNQKSKSNRNSHSKSFDKNKYKNNKSIQLKTIKHIQQNVYNYIENQNQNPPVMQFVNQEDQYKQMKKATKNNINPILQNQDFKQRQALNHKNYGNYQRNHNHKRTYYQSISDQNSNPVKASISQFSSSDLKNHPKSQQAINPYQNHNQHLHPQVKTPNIPKPQKNRRQQIKKLAEQHAKQQNKKNVMIPIYNQSGYKLVPLSSLSKQEIIAYVKNQKDYQNQKKRLQNQKDQRQTNQLKNKNKTPDKYLSYNSSHQNSHHHHYDSSSTHYKKSNIPAKRPQSAHSNNHRKVSIQNQIKEEDHYQSENYQQDYQSDFQSMSIANSAIKSHSWKKQNYAAIDESINDEGYSQDFESYSQSMLSRTQQKPNSTSQIGESIRSISQSYRAK